MFQISKTFDFSASHQLEGLPADHQCARLHGHNYVVRVELTAPSLDDVGFVYDYGRLSFIKDHLDENFDHRHLNDVLPFNPTAEHMARHLAEVVARLVDRDDVEVSVSVSETPKTWATYRVGEAA